MALDAKCFEHLDFCCESLEVFSISCAITHEVEVEPIVFMLLKLLLWLVRELISKECKLLIILIS